MTLEELQSLRDSGLSFASVLVYAYIKERGEGSIDAIAEACGLSMRTVYHALVQIKKLPQDRQA